MDTYHQVQVLGKKKNRPIWIGFYSAFEYNVGKQIADALAKEYGSKLVRIVAKTVKRKPLFAVAIYYNGKPDMRYLHAENRATAKTLFTAAHTSEIMFGTIKIVEVAQVVGFFLTNEKKMILSSD